MPVSHHAATVARDLDAVFTVPRMRAVWKRHIRPGLRDQPLGDLHDFLDVHRNLTPFLRALRSEVVAGQYRPHTPEIALLEKRDGIPRRLNLLAPSDALLLQTLVALLETAINHSQPHPNAFYAQSHAPLGPENVDSTFFYPWWLLWPEFQKRIWRFTTAYQFVVVTDIANYFDCIPLSALRNRVASFGAFNETVLNFLFFLLDAFTWRPFYMPASGVGLPQINFDAPRLLAHAYLFTIDSELQSRTNGDFVRWMDDINCGVDSRHAGRQLLRSLEIVLNSLGLRLNTAKSRILPAQEAVQHFWISENRALTILSNLCATATPNSFTWQLYRSKARRLYRTFRVRNRVGQWEKVVKRYFTLFSNFGDKELQKEVPSLLVEAPALRHAVFRYYTKLGPSPARFHHIADFLRSGRCLDDASLFESVRTLIHWHCPVRSKRRTAILALIPAIQSLGSVTPVVGNLTSAGVSSAIWLLAKYGSSTELGTFLQSTKAVWTRSAWAARQAAGSLPLLSKAVQEEVRIAIVESGLTEALRVLASVFQIRRLTALDQQLRAYLLHRPSPGWSYPLEKVIIARIVLNGRLPATERHAFRQSLERIISDPCYLAILRRRQ